MRCAACAELPHTPNSPTLCRHGATSRSSLCHTQASSPLAPELCKSEPRNVLHPSAPTHGAGLWTNIGSSERAGPPARFGPGPARLAPPRSSSSKLCQADSLEMCPARGGARGARRGKVGLGASGGVCSLKRLEEVWRRRPQVRSGSRSEFGPGMGARSSEVVLPALLRAAGRRRAAIAHPRSGLQAGHERPQHRPPIENARADPPDAPKGGVPKPEAGRQLVQSVWRTDADPATSLPSRVGPRMRGCRARQNPEITQTPTAKLGPPPTTLRATSSPESKTRGHVVSAGPMLDNFWATPVL